MKPKLTRGGKFFLWPWLAYPVVVGLVLLGYCGEPEEEPITRQIVIRTI